MEPIGQKAIATRYEIYLKYHLKLQNESSRQSPINIPMRGQQHESHLVPAENMQIRMWQGSLQNQVLHDGVFNDTVQTEVTDGQLVFVDSNGNVNAYQLLQFHLHAPSEHTIGGRSYDLELHLVHVRFDEESATEQLGVVGIMFDRETGGDEENPFIESLYARQVRIRNETLTREIPLMKLTQQVNYEKFYNYKGSLTTPFCAEIVEWLVVDDPQPISARQLKEFNDSWKDNFEFAKGKGNNRITLPLNGRKIFAKGIFDGLNQPKSFLKMDTI